jgi:formylglycine-generating enzyme required for sulfatase activity
MALVEGGAFLMGSREIPSDEEPVRSVTVDSFYIGKFEVTQAEWKAVMGNNPSLFRGDNLPVEYVDWFAAVEFCNKKSKIDGLTPCYSGTGGDIACDFGADGYRLPTEAEWEYAGRGGLGSRHYNYCGGDDPGEVAWYEVNSQFKTQAAGRKKPNELGIYDMSGNVGEWCWDRYDKDYYKAGPPENPSGPAMGNRRTYRGGGACDPRMLLRCARRFSRPPAFKNYDLGFRIVKNGTGKPPQGMVFVKGGTFKMGGGEGENGEKTVHRVTLDSFYIGKYEVTQGEWIAVMGKNPSYRKGSPTPVHFIEWCEAVEYCNRRSRKEGLTPCYTGTGGDIACDFAADGYRLPTEAEWEYAARGGSRSRHYKYSGGNDPGEVAWYIKNKVIYFQPVGQRKPNELGIYDMSGNMWEFCWDRYDFDYYQNSPLKNPRGPLSGVRRVVRGGGFFSTEISLWSASRLYFEPYRKGIHIGFRVVRNAGSK